jgi:predicted esterase
MDITVDKVVLEIDSVRVNALYFHPSSPIEGKACIFTHGFTSHKASILNWGSRCAEEGLPTIIFDQPGHFLGSYNDIESFDQFKSIAPQLFFKALDVIRGHYPQAQDITIGGHSLGALTSLIALESVLDSEKSINCICVGFGLPPTGVTHVFNTPFYKSTLNLRGQLVSKHLAPEIVFPWIKEAKEALKVSGRRIHFITGEDDMVVGKDGSERLAQQLTTLGNEVTISKPKRLAHHLPELAAGHIKSFLKEVNFIS